VDSTVTIAGNFGEDADSTLIGSYKLIRQLGEGGMGVVYHAQQLEPIRRDVALKIIKPGMDSKQVIARFESERQALALMDHANIARVFDAGATPTGLPYFAMELVDGTPITSYCDSKRLTLKERIGLFLPVCEAIQHAHQKGIIHRDIKPSNLLVAEQDGRPVPKVIDFGLAKALGHQLSDATMMTNLGTVVGTLEYMSPEQADMVKHDIDTRSDVYSLGVVLYELLTGTTPLEHERLAKAGYVETLQRIRGEEPVPPSARLRQSTTSADIAERRRTDRARLPKLLHGELDWITMKALEKDRTRRYETVNGLARDLQRYLEGEPVEAGRPTATYRLRKFARKHRLWLSAAAAFTALLAAAVVVSSWMAIRASRAEAEARAVNDFLQNDLLAQASPNAQARPDTKPDPDLKVRTALDRAAAGIEGKFGTQPLVEASIRQTIGKTYMDLGLYPEAQRQTERALELRRRVLGDNHTDTLTSMDSLANSYTRQGKYAQAEALHARVLEVRRRVLGEEHPETATSMLGLATDYLNDGKYPQAEPLFINVIGVRRRLMGEEHPDTLAARYLLAGLYYRQGKYAQAEPIFTGVVEVEGRVLGEEHPDTLRGVSALAATYLSLRKIAQAETVYAELLNIQRRVLGDEHPRVLSNMNDLAVVYQVEGKYAQAEPLYTRVVELDRRVLGEEHPLTLSTISNLANLYLQEGRHPQAEALLTKVLEARSRVLGGQHPDTLKSMALLADVYTGEGQYVRAEALFAKVLQARTRVLGSQHPDTADTLASIGWIRLKQQKYSEAEAALRDALTTYEKIAPDRWQRYHCESMLGDSLTGQKKYAEAEQLLLSGYEGMTQRQATISAGSRSVLAEAKESILQLYRSSGKQEKAAEWRQKLQLPQPAASAR
jgi:non-specific serine/threonine protein kinase/serine/threonine-protein kinase